MSHEKENRALSSGADGSNQTAADNLLQANRPVFDKDDPVLQAQIPECSLRELRESDSPPFIREARSESYLLGLFPADKLLRFIRGGEPRTDLQSAVYRDACLYPQMVPNALPSRRKEAQPESRDYLIVRFLQGSLDRQSARINYLRDLQQLHLSLVVFDANRTLESWFSAGGKTGAELGDFFNTASRLGCDHLTWRLSTPCCVPDAYRANDSSQAYAVLRKAGFRELTGLETLHFPRRQMVFYFSPQ